MTKGEEVAAFVIQHRGYLVLGFLAPVPLYSSISTFANLPLNQPIKILSVTSEEDWQEQAAIVNAKFTARELYPDGLTQPSRTRGYFYRANTN